MPFIRVQKTSLTPQIAFPTPQMDTVITQVLPTHPMWLLQPSKLSTRCLKSISRFASQIPLIGILVPLIWVNVIH